MPIAFWRDEYCTGDAVIDQQHQYLFSIVNKLHDAMLEGHGSDVLKQTLDELVSYTIEHFRMEEKRMFERRYPDYEKHKQQHDNLKQEVQQLRDKQRHQAKFLSIEVSKFLTSWLIHHIKGEDKKMIEFFKRNPLNR